ncbi:KH domain-containing protein [Nitrosophilus kaiyonis]|uniref:KH domain-containing protein n=1 Tax=Nitrosophilus kaiyonis TaxID=2930200 RepID=UPI002493A5BA|nr:KH domain-containing protein [Nitrosophilus kaiyonis]
MIENFVLKFAKLIATKPEDIEVERKDINKEYSEITIYANKADAGKLIGKEGKMIGAIKTLISGCKAKDGISYKVNVVIKGD